MSCLLQGRIILFVYCYIDLFIIINLPPTRRMILVLSCICRGNFQLLVVQNVHFTRQRRISMYLSHRACHRSIQNNGQDALRKPQKKVLLLKAGPSRPYPPPALNGPAIKRRFFFGFPQLKSALKNVHGVHCKEFSSLVCFY